LRNCRSRLRLVAVFVAAPRVSPTAERMSAWIDSEKCPSSKRLAYKAKPKYCLMVLGREARRRVWLVLDGDTLYVDRSGNSLLSPTNERQQILQGRPCARRRLWTRRIAGCAVCRGKKPRSG
jgi:hypothetical protein